MGDFANSIFSVMLGWIQNTVAWIWNTAGSQDGGGVIGWIGRNWLGLAIVLCVVGVAMDLIIHLLRWQPYKVWASFLRRVTGRQDEPEEQRDSARLQRQWVYADGTTEYDEVEVTQPPEERSQTGEYAAAPDEEALSARYARYARPTQEAAPEQPAMAEETPQEAPAAVRGTVRRRRYVPEGNAEMPLRYAPPPTAEEEPAYNAPYYPPQWKKPSNAGATTLDDGGSGL